MQMIFVNTFQNTPISDKIGLSRFPLLEKDLTSEEHLVYNWVPKCGSSTTSSLIKQLEARNHFKVIYVLKEGRKSFNKEEQQTVVRKTNHSHSPWLYIQQFHMINFTDFGMEMPVYINLVREPIERLMSEYYYIRFKAPRPMAESVRKMSFEDCIKNKMKECTDPKTIFKILPYFCGSLPRCTEPSTWVLERAKQNVERYYSLVGHVEELEKFYTVLEKTMPQYFRGLNTLYKKKGVRLKKETATKVKKTLSDSSREYLRSLLGLEYEFYAYIKKRFEDSYRKVMKIS